ncbi:hypothetical protein [Streptomyces bobili]|uniref:hypothetical protein n=1 Tax=Streptomyces bobili TaxID=67280 RepID=UPI00378998BE
MRLRRSRLDRLEDDVLNESRPLAPILRQVIARHQPVGPRAGRHPHLAAARPDSRPRPEAHRAPGRVHVVEDGTAHQTQALILTDTEAANWLTARAAAEI